MATPLSIAADLILRPTMADASIAHTVAEFFMSEAHAAHSYTAEQVASLTNRDLEFTQKELSGLVKAKALRTRRVSQSGQRLYLYEVNFSDEVLAEANAIFTAEALAEAKAIFAAQNPQPLISDQAVTALSEVVTAIATKKPKSLRLATDKVVRQQLSEACKKLGGKRLAPRGFASYSAFLTKIEVKDQVITLDPVGGKGTVFLTVFANGSVGVSHSELEA